MREDIEADITDFANELFDLAGLDLDADCEPTEEGLKVNVSGDDVSILLARNAEVLDALEYLANRVFAHEPGIENRIVFDSSNYRARREKELRLMAEKAAERVRATRVPFSFDPLSPNERRIIHLALVDDNTVRSESRGDGPDRKVTIYPA